MRIRLSTTWSTSAAKSADIVNEAYPLLVGVKLGTVRDFNYEARDKYALTAYLTVPPGG